MRLRLGRVLPLKQLLSSPSRCRRCCTTAAALLQPPPLPPVLPAPSPTAPPPRPCCQVREGADFVGRLQTENLWVVVLEKMRKGLG